MIAQEMRGAYMRAHTFEALRLLVCGLCFCCSEPTPCSRFHNAKMEGPSLTEGKGWGPW